MSARFVALVLAAVGVLGVFGCTSTPRDMESLVGEFEERGVELTPAAIAGYPIEGCLDDQLATRYDLDGGGRMLVYEYPDEQAAREVADPIPPNAFAGVCGAFDYRSDLRYFLWGQVIFTTFEQDAEQLAAAREIAGEPFACALGRANEPKAGVPRCEFAEE